MEHVTFNSLGTRCAGDLYLPETSGPAPGLVRIRLADITPAPTYESVAAMTQ